MSGGVWQMPRCIKEHVKVHSSKCGGFSDHDIACSSQYLHLIYWDFLHCTLGAAQTRRDGSFNALNASPIAKAHPQLRRLSFLYAYLGRRPTI